jgi:hypothetical protein
VSPRETLGGRCLDTADFRLDCRSRSRPLELLDGTLDALERLKGGRVAWAGGTSELQPRVLLEIGGTFPEGTFS